MTTLFLKRETTAKTEDLRELSSSTVMVLKEAQRQGIQWEGIPYTELFKLTYKKQVKFFHSRIPSETTEFAYYSCKNKNDTKNILREVGVSVSKGFILLSSDKREYQANLFKNLQKPVIVKPIDASLGNNVYLNISTQKDFFHATKSICEFYHQEDVMLLAEQMFMGDEYRILATQEKILSVIKRLPANVVGDGKHSIEELVAVKNQDPIRAQVVMYSQIEIDTDVMQYLQGQDLTLKSVIEAERRVFLRPHSSLDISLGGDTVDVTDHIHPSVTKIVQTVMKSIPGLSLAGIDFMTHDIEKKQTPENYVVVEVNSSPNLEWNEFPLEGPHRRVAFEFLRIMYPELRDVDTTGYLKKLRQQLLGVKSTTSATARDPQ